MEREKRKLEEVTSRKEMTPSQIKKSLHDITNCKEYIERRCDQIAATYTALQNDPIVRLIQLHGTPADKEYFRIMEQQENMSDLLRNELLTLYNKNIEMNRLMLAMRTLPHQCYQCVYAMHIDKKKWEAVESEQCVSSSQLSRILKRSYKMMSVAYNSDLTDEQLAAAYYDLEELQKQKKESGDHQITIDEILGSGE